MVTAIPVLLVAWWLVRGVGLLWRRSIWEDAGDVLEACALAAGGEVRPLWNGWSVVSGQGRLEFRGGLRGHVTLAVPTGGTRRERLGLLDPDEALALLEDPPAAQPPDVSP